MKHYKATRPDGTDFKTGRFVYAVGETVEHPNTKRFSDMRPNEPRTYLSTSVEPAESLIGGAWPCRLFLVEPVGKTVRRTDGRHPHKRGCRAVKVVEEVEAWRALGPNGEKVAALISRTATLTWQEAQDLRAAWGAAWDAAWGAARGAAWDAALALVAQDIITAEQFDTLIGPWQKVIGS